MVNRRNRLEVPQARGLMEQLKNEIAMELGIPNYDQLDKGDLPARVHGKIGGNMTRKLIQYAESQMAKDPNALEAIRQTSGVNEDDIQVVHDYMTATTPESTQMLQ